MIHCPQCPVWASPLWKTALVWGWGGRVYMYTVLYCSRLCKALNGGTWCHAFANNQLLGRNVTNSRTWLLYSHNPSWSLCSILACCVSQSYEEEYILPVSLPEELTLMGIECFYDNQRLATWADLLFLCCLPRHLPQVCSDIRAHLPRHCVIYSLVSAVTVKR